MNSKVGSTIYIFHKFPVHASNSNDEIDQEASEHYSEDENPGEIDGTGNDPVASKFQQNPLVDNDYTFASAQGKYCMHRHFRKLYQAFIHD